MESSKLNSNDIESHLIPFKHLIFQKKCLHFLCIFLATSIVLPLGQRG